MPTSQNGYPALDSSTTGPLPRLRRWTIPGTHRHLLLRDGAVGFLLVFLASWFHGKIERLDLGVWDEWGWAARPIRGSSTISNHASGTAADLDATRHPLGVPTLDTFTPRQAKRIRRKLRYRFLGLIRWGGDYAGRPDAMHFEVVGSLRACERLARLLMKTRRGRRILAANPGARAVIKS
ncbi:M15 family metallopeptidase [Nocardioides sp. LHD-245]|uniref:M15 family metallopeptidase n=1 Tax=Nocardioides sp. LHD-245 TaxID=3051387 RepID=UPI0027E08A66|nr:M15 family metallopeptidase [Nocardioides sp. LHD-245]